MRFNTKHSSKGYFNWKINVSKLIIPSAGPGCVRSCRNLLVLMCCLGRQGHCRKVAVGL